MLESAPLPKQDRSRKTLAKLLDATVRSLETHGLEGCTMPLLAAAADISPAAVYRHFAYKDALLRAAFLHALQAVSPEPVLQASSLEATVDNVIATLFAEAHNHAGLSHALARFVAVSPDDVFARQVKALRTAKLQRMTDALLAHRERIRHPEPQRAATFAVSTASASIDAATASLKVGPSLTPKQFSAELARMFVAYLRRKP